jgi:hypothetical protein
MKAPAPGKNVHICIDCNLVLKSPRMNGQGNDDIAREVLKPNLYGDI